jgi:hypothetical protein
VADLLQRKVISSPEQTLFMAIWDIRSAAAMFAINQLFVTVIPALGTILFSILA